MVEDHADIADLYQLKLQLSGYRAALATDGSRGLEMARTLQPDLVLLDIHLPGMDGLELLAALRAEETTRDVPVIVFSDDDSTELMEEAERLGAAAYLVKARVLPSRLEQIIRSVLSGSADPKEDVRANQAS
jgi:DNA-binding response OmpR family regulator